MKNHLKAILILSAGLLAVGCGEKKEAPPMPAANPEPLQQAPAKAKPVMASTDPQHGGLVKRMGDYMVEMKPNPDGTMEVYVQKVEGAVSAADNVQLEVTLTPKAVDAGAAKPGTPAERSLIFYPEDGKLKGKVAGLVKGLYKIRVALFDDKNNMAEAAFDDVDLSPEVSDLKAEHEGEVYVLDDKKLEAVRVGDNIEVFVSNLKDGTPIKDQVEIQEMRMQAGDQKSEPIRVSLVNGRLLSKIPITVPENETVKLVDVNMSILGKLYHKFRVPAVPKAGIGAGGKGEAKSPAVEPQIPTERPKATASKAILQNTPAKTPETPDRTARAAKTTSTPPPAAPSQPGRKTRSAKKAP